MKRILQIGMVVAIFSAMGCGAYYLDDEGAWVVEGAVDVYTYPFISDRLTFTVSWNQSSYPEDLIVSLVTPYGDLILDGGPQIDGCYFLGTYNDSPNEKISMIECVDSLFGHYDLQIDNIGYVMRNPLIEITLEHQTDNVIDTDVVNEFGTIFPNETMVVTYVL